MRRVIRRQNTKQYLREDGTWTYAPDIAADFANAREALEAKHRFGLRHVDIVLQMLDRPDPEYELIVPLTGY